MMNVYGMFVWNLFTNIMSFGWVVDLKKWNWLPKNYVPAVRTLLHKKHKICIIYVLPV